MPYRPKAAELKNREEVYCINSARDGYNRTNRFPAHLCPDHVSLGQNVGAMGAQRCDGISKKCT